MYADRVSGAMAQTIGETERRRRAQAEYNAERGITPTTIVKAVREQEMAKLGQEQAAVEFQERQGLPPDELLRLVLDLERAMQRAAGNLEFERAAQLRDRVVELRGQLAESGGSRPAGTRSRERRPVRRRRGP